MANSLERNYNKSWVENAYKLSPKGKQLGAKLQLNG
jgi:hypothetical protein